MDEDIKSRIILILAILTIIFFLGTINSCNNLRILKGSRNKEMELRLDVEEKLSNLGKDKERLEDRVKALTQEFEEEKVSHQASKKSLLQEQLVNQSLKEELAKKPKLKEALEDDLKEALVTDKK